MKKLVPILLLVLSASASKAQTPFATIDSVNINNINASILVHGDMWWDGTPLTGVPKCFFPNGAPTSIGSVSGLWISGYDASSQLHTAAATYRLNGFDYWPGPLDAGDTLTYATSQNWAKIWKVNRTDIDTFLTLTTHTITNTPSAILTWPAKGNVNATGNAGAALTITSDMAPFIDVNGNGIYEPLLGEYPDIKGDQALWWVFSDNGPTHTETHGKPLSVEIHAMSYAYKRSTLIDNVIYYDYTIINKSSNTYSNCRVGQFSDMDLGYWADDFIGFDSSHRMGIMYNGVSDDGLSGGHPLNSYGTNIPISGVTMISTPADDSTLLSPPGSFISCFDLATIDTEYNNYLHSKYRTGNHITNDYVGPGVPTTGAGSGPEANYIFPGEPNNSTQWSECSSTNTPGDRRFILASSNFTMEPGTSHKLVLALVTTARDTNNACPTAGFDGIKIVADTAWRNYYNSLPGLAAPALTINTNIILHPNPTHDHLFIDDKTTGTKTIVVYNTLGQQVNVNISAHQNSSDISVANLPPSVYYVKYNNGITQKTFSFVKE